MAVILATNKLKSHNQTVIILIVFVIISDFNISRINGNLILNVKKRHDKSKIEIFFQCKLLSIHF